MKKIIAAAMVLTLLLSSCGQRAPQSTALPVSSQSEEKELLGRYIEEDISTKEMGRYPSIQAIGNKLVMQSCEGNLSMHFHASYTADSGFSENEKNFYSKPIREKLYGSEDQVITNGTVTQTSYFGRELLGPDGKVYAQIYTSSSDSANAENSEHKRFFMRATHTEAEILSIPELTSSTGVGFSYSGEPFRISRNNTVIFVKKDKVYFYNCAGSDAVFTGSIDSPSNVKAAIIGSTCMLVGDDTTALYNLKTGKKLADINLKNIKAVCEGSDNAFYAINTDGIWRIAEGGVTERIVDSLGTVFSQKSIAISDMTVSEDGVFYVACSRSFDESLQAYDYMATKLYKYTYSATVPSERSKSLHIWTLRDSEALREAAAIYMREHDDTMVNIEVASPGAENDEKAIEDLKQRVESGTSPDIINTDGLSLAALNSAGLLQPLTSFESYADKDIYKNGVLNGELLSFICRVDICKSIGVGEAENYLINIENEAVKIEKLGKPALSEYDKWEEARVNYTCFFSEDEMWRTLHTMYSPQIWRGGEPSEEVLEDLFKTAKLFYENSFLTPEDSLTLEKNSDFKYVAVSRKYYPISSNEGSSKITAFLRTNEPGSQAIMGYSGSISAILSMQLGICKGSENKDTAESFIRLAASPRLQKLTYDGDIGIGEFYTLYEKLITGVPITAYSPVYKNDALLKQLVFNYVKGEISIDIALQHAKSSFV